jgi:hypothetical protein
MPIAFCASAQALAACLAQHAPAADPHIVHCETVWQEGNDAAPTSVQERAVIQLEASPLLPLSYQVSLVKVVSMLAIESKLVLVGPSLMRRGVLPFGISVDDASAARAVLICTLEAAPRWDVVLRSGATRLVLLSGDVFALYEPAGATLTACGHGSLIMIGETKAPGNVPAALVDVLVEGMSVSWPH